MSNPKYLKGPCRVRFTVEGDVASVIFDSGYQLVPVAEETDYDGPVVRWLVVRRRDGAWRNLTEKKWTLPSHDQQT